MMLSHDNVTFNAYISANITEMKMFDVTFVSYLPLNHIAAQELDIYCSMRTGGTVYFAQPDALKGSLVKTLKAVHPTLFGGVPRVWEKIHENMEKVFAKMTGSKLCKKLFLILFFSFLSAQRSGAA